MENKMLGDQRIKRKPLKCLTKVAERKKTENEREGTFDDVILENF